MYSRTEPGRFSDVFAMRQFNVTEQAVDSLRIHWLTA